MPDRYVCMSCQKGHDAPGFCPHCRRGELLDMTIASERELLADLSAEKVRGRRANLRSLVLVIGLFLLSVGVSSLLQSQFGWRFEAAELLVTLLLPAIMLPVVLLLKKRWEARDAPAVQAPDPVPWAEASEEPVAAPEPVAAAPVRRRPVQRER